MLRPDPLGAYALIQNPVLCFVDGVRTHSQNLKPQFVALAVSRDRGKSEVELGTG